MTTVGTRVARREDAKFLTVGGSYVGDLHVAGVAHLTFVRSTVAHARVTSVEVDAARAAPGVIGVYTAADLDLAPVPPEVPIANALMAQPVLAADVVRFVGEPVVAILTEERYQAEDAAELVYVDYDPLPAVVDAQEAADGATLLFPEAGSNVAVELTFGETGDAFFEGCDVVVRQHTVNQRLAPCPLEVRSTLARWEDDGRLTIWCSSQAPHLWRREIARGLDVPEESIRLIAPDVGGGFGSKIHSYPEDIVVAAVARREARPVRWVETRSESMVALGHGRGQLQHVEIGGSRDGTVLAFRNTVVQDCGAYPRLASFLVYFTRGMATGVYRIPKVEFNSRSVVTNTTPTVAYRGAGRPEATAAIERAMDLFAAEIGMDPVDLRRRNLVPADAFPYTTPTGQTYDVGDYERALDMLLEAAGYESLRAQQRRRREAGVPRQLGIGVSTYVEITGGVAGNEYGAVEITPAGRAIVRVGTSSHGQGHATSFTMIAADTLGIDLADVEFVQSDTDEVPFGVGTMGSRSLQHGGGAVLEAARATVDEGKRIAADLLGVAPDDVVLDLETGCFTATGAPERTIAWAEVAEAAIAHRDGGRFVVEVAHEPRGASFPFGAHLVVVEVDTETGKVEVQRVVAVDDAGAIVNPLLFEGQVHGGLAQGIAQALVEEVRYDEDGNPVTSNLADYAFITAAELPSFETLHMETPTPMNELGAKGVGESGTIGATPAVQSAVVDALAHLGVRHVDMPATPERVWQAIEAARGSRS